MFRKTSFFLAFAFSVAGSFLFHEAQAQNKDTVWVPVIFYDYWVDANSTNPDFEIAPASLQGFPGMVYDTMDSQRKPVPTPAACPTPSTAAPAACHLAEWFRVSGIGGSDKSCVFTCDSVTDPQKKRWKWVTASGTSLPPNPLGTGGVVGPNWDQTYNMRNIIIYDSIPFLHLGRNGNTAQLGIYEINYSNTSTQFFPLDGRGFGNQPTGQNPMHNFGMAMELHTTFSYKKGLNFTFAGDDDCWVFINGKKVVDLGGRHGALTSSVNLDTMAGLTVGDIYNLDFFYAERHTSMSNIRITSNMIAPAKIGIDVFPSATIHPGDTAKLTGTLLDGAGNPMPGNLSDSITWSIDPATQKTGDILLVNKGKITFVIAGPTTVSRTITVIGKYGKTDVIGTVQITILPAIPKTIVIYNSELPPGPTVLKLPDLSQLITIAAGTQYLLVGNVFDKYAQWLSQYRIAPDQSKISWEAKSRAGSLNSRLDALTGAVIHFTPTRAYDTVTIIATLQNVIMDTVRFYVVPGPEKYLVIEPKGILDTLKANPLGTLLIMEGENSNPVYTTVRDTFGNFIRYGSISAWSSLDNSIVTVANGNISFGEGIVNRVITATDSITKITAVDTNKLLKPDTSNVKLVQYYYTDLRIVIGTNTNPADLSMNTNQDTTLTVQGKRSNDGVWVDVTGNWHSSPNLKIDPTAPTNHSWRFSPTDTGTGIIFVTMNNEKTKPDTLPAHFTPGPPVRATIEILTPPAEIIAGKPISALVRVYDKDGNSYTYKFDTTAGGRAAYHDLLGTGVYPPEPFIMIDGKKVLLYGSPWESGNETFIDGRDTVSFTLYYAPLDTTKVHQIFTNLIIGTDTIRASSIPFVLHPDKLAQVRIEYPNGSKVPDTLNLINSVTLISRGYDQYGNPYGETIGNWTVDDSLHDISGPKNGSSIYYDPSVATKNEGGHIIVNHNGIADTVYVIITGPLISLVSANTRDISGNGILDRIELQFDRGFQLPANASFAGMAVVYNSDTLPVSRILSTGSGTDNSVWVVELTESHTDLPQTGWTPKIILPQQNAYGIGPATITAIDSAGPVVWKVLTYLVDITDHRSDSVVVTLSEPVQRYDGGSLNVGDKPMDIFYVWQKGANDEFVLVKNIFANINNLKRDPGKSNTITFRMSNGNDLNRSFYLSIADSTRRYLNDASAQAVPPNLNNNPKQVQVIPVRGTIITNNPIRPVFKRDPPLWFPIENRPESKDWPAIDKGGAVIRVIFATLPPEESKATLRYSIKIYDVVGNLVQSGDEPDFLHKSNKYDPKELENQSTAEGVVYWNGANSMGMAVAPGIYRAVVYLRYTGVSSKNSSKFPNQRYVVKLGIRR